MESRSRRYVDIEIDTVHPVEAPEKRNPVKKEMPAVNGKIETIPAIPSDAATISTFDLSL